LYHISGGIATKGENPVSLILKNDDAVVVYEVRAEHHG